MQKQKSLGKKKKKEKKKKWRPRPQARPGRSATQTTSKTRSQRDLGCVRPGSRATRAERDPGRARPWSHCDLAWVARDQGCSVTPVSGFFFFFFLSSMMNTHFLLVWFSFAIVAADLFVFHFSCKSNLRDSIFM